MQLRMSLTHDAASADRLAVMGQQACCTVYQQIEQLQ
jgi:hypothetical protein